MIVDSLKKASRYESMHPLFAKAFEFLKTASSLKDGKYELEGTKLYATISHNNLRQTADLEGHRKYIDIQYLIDGEESFRCADAEKCTNVSVKYSEESDIVFFSDCPTMEYSVGEGMMSIFFPEDLHAPLIGSGIVRKVVVKVLI